MPFTRLEYEKKWTSRTDFPTYEGSENQVREDMQYHPDAVREYINETLLKELEGDTGAGLIGDSRNGNVGATMDSVFRTLEEHAEELKDLAAGEAPESVRSVKVTFTAEQWNGPGETGEFELRISRATHKRMNDAFGCKLQDGAGKTNSWQVLGTNVGYDGETGEIVLTARNAYPGSAVFFGV